MGVGENLARWPDKEKEERLNTEYVVSIIKPSSLVLSGLSMRPEDLWVPVYHLVLPSEH